MQEKGQVIQITNDTITVIPLISNACLSCASGCSKRGKPFVVVNPRHFAVTQGSIVKIGASKGTAALQGAIALLFPFFCAIAGFFCAKPVASLFGKTAGDGLRALFVLLFLVLSGILVFIVTRKIPFPGKPEIIEVF